MSLSRYRMTRGASLRDLPRGVRQDTRKHTRHVLRPPLQAAQALLAKPGEAAWRTFAAAYRAALQERWDEDRSAFDELAELARGQAVHLGCSCPTQKNPDVRHCHTWLALEFMAEHYADLDVRFPDPNAG